MQFEYCLIFLLDEEMKDIGEVILLFGYIVSVGNQNLY